MPDVTTLLDGRAFLEGPRFRGDTLFVSDMHAHEVLRVDSAGATEIVARVETCPSGLGFLPDGRMLIVSMEDRRLLRLDGSRLVEAADLSGLALDLAHWGVADPATLAFLDSPPRVLVHPVDARQPEDGDQEDRQVANDAPR